MRFTKNLLPSRSSNVGILQLNNPSALNALTLEMVRCLNDVLPSWQSDLTLCATLMTGSAESKRPSFCSGGDVKGVYLSGLESASGKGHGYGERGLLTADFFREEYQMNYKIATQPPHVPQVSVWDGIVMGGGVGLSVHGKYRIATDRTVFAMPETGIGFFPDVGGMWWLPRLAGGLGSYVALTGARLNAADLLYAKVATHYVSSERLEDLKDAVVKASKSGEDEDEEGTLVGGRRKNVASVLMSFHEESVAFQSKESHLARHRDEIDASFGEDKSTVEDIVIALHELDSDFGRDTLLTLRKMSPTSLKVTLEGLKRGKALPDIGEVLKMEYRMSQGFMREGGDFYEGIRAVLVDKDGNPQWKPEKLEDVTEEMVQSYFQKLGGNELELDDVGGASNL